MATQWIQCFPGAGALLAGFAVAIPAAAFIQGSYMCKSVFWSNETKTPRFQCQWFQYLGPRCIHLWGITNREKWYRQISSYGPDPGLLCTIYEGDNCTGGNWTLQYPGIDDLRLIGWNDRVASYSCIDNPD